MAQQRQQFSFTYADLQELTGLSRAGVSQHVIRGNLDASDLASVCAFIARYGKPEIRLEIMQKMMGIDRQVLERSRPQSTIGLPRDEYGRVAEESLIYPAAPKSEGKPKPTRKRQGKGSEAKPGKAKASRAKSSD
jgi:hypothetical protein